MKNMPNGLINGLLGIAIFSGSLPATRLAVVDFQPLFLTVTRATIAGFIAIVLLYLLKAKLPSKGDIKPLIIVALGVVVGFPLFTAFALTYVTSSHSTVFVGLLPLTTAIFGFLRGGERPKPLFWFFSSIGALAVVGFALRNGVSLSLEGDLLMLAAIIVCGFGYAEGAVLTRTLGGWQVICWALVLSLPFMLFLTLLTAPPSFAHVSLSSWACLAYISLFSMLIGFVFWYRGLAQGGIAAIGQLQLLQPFLSLALAALLLNETIEISMIGVCAIVVLCVAASRRFS